MHPTEPKNAFLLMRANGWSLRSIATKLGVPKSTLFNWESEPETCRAINVIKSVQVAYPFAQVGKANRYRIHIRKLVV